jgi:hypothetical protein
MKLSSEKLIEYFKNYFDNSDIINKFLEKLLLSKQIQRGGKFDFEMFPENMIVFDKEDAQKESKKLFITIEEF